MCNLERVTDKIIKKMVPEAVEYADEKVDDYSSQAVKSFCDCSFYNSGDSKTGKSKSKRSPALNCWVLRFKNDYREFGPLFTDTIIEIPNLGLSQKVQEREI